MSKKVKKTAENERIGRLSVGALTFVALMALNVPWLPEYFSYDLDASWVFTLHKAVVEQWQFGKDIVWHYGPLGFLYGKYYYPETYNYLLLGWITLSGIFFAGSYSVIMNSHKSPNFIALPIIAVIISIAFDAMFLLIPVIFFIHSVFVKYKHSYIINWFLILACAAGVLVKISYGLLALGLIILAEAYRFIYKKRPPVYLLGFLLLVVGMWDFLGQDIANITSYFKGAIEHGRGFANTARPMDAYILTTMFFYLLGALLFLSIVGKVFWKERKDAVPFFVLAISVVVVIGLKVGFLNNNSMHIYEAIALLMVVVLLCRDLFFESMSALQKNILMGYSFVVVSFAVIGMTNEQNSLEIDSLIKMNAGVITDSSPVAGRLDDVASGKEGHYQRALNGIVHRSNILPVSGTVDLYNCYQIGLLAAGLDYSPRPVMQGYHTYTPYLSNLNKEHITSEKAAENIVFNIDTFMNRYPSIDDGASWPALLTYYDIEKIHGNFAYLKKRKSPRIYDLSPIEEFTAEVGEVIEVPKLSGSEGIWLSIDIKPTFMGRLAKLVFRNLHVDMKITTKSGYERMTKIIPAVSKEGFLLSPLIDNVLQFAIFATEEKKKMEPLSIERIQLSVEGDSWWSDWFYKDDIKVSFSHFNFEKQESWVRGLDLVADSAKLTLSPLKSFVAPIENVVDQHISYAGSETEDFVRINGTSRLFYPLYGTETSVSGEFGVFNQFYFIKSPTIGVNFAIYGVKSDKKQEKLWNGDVGELSLMQGGINKKLQLKLKAGKYTGLIFETKPVDNEKSNWAYWANIAVR